MFRRKKREADLERELRDHIELETEELEDRDAGDEARRPVPAAPEAAAVLDELRLGDCLGSNRHQWPTTSRT